MLGPSIGGLIVTIAGVSGALLVDGFSFIFSALLLLFFVPAGPQKKVSAELTESLRRQLLGGMLRLVTDPLLRCVTLVSAFINLSIVALLTYLLPVMVKASSGTALNVGVIMSAFGIGALAASAAYTWKGLKLSPLNSMLISVLVATVSIASMAFVSLTVLPILFFVVGACVGYLGPMEQTLVQDHSPRDDIARIMLAYSAMRTVLVPAGFLLVGASMNIGSSNFAFLVVAAPLLVPCAQLIFHALKCRQIWEKDSFGGTRSETALS